MEFFDEQKVLKQKPFLTDFTVTLDQFKATICNFFYTEYVSLVSRNEVERNERIALRQETNTRAQLLTVFHTTDNSTHSKIAKIHKTSHSSFDAYFLNNGYYYNFFNKIIEIWLI